MRLLGRISNQNVVILIDGGSTHNFVQAHLVKHLGLISQPTQVLRVLVESSNEVEYHQLRLGATVHVEGCMFMMDLLVLLLYGADIVLGVQWLKSLGLVLTDYNELIMKFVHEGKLIKLKGDTNKDLQAISSSQLCHMIQTNGANKYFHIKVCPQTLPSQTTHPKIITFTTQFASLFQTPITLPSSRPTNHSIHLVPNSTPVNVRTYRYPYFQKHEIEMQVATMLQTGIIRPSTSPFSSSVLLIKKRDGS